MDVLNVYKTLSNSTPRSEASAALNSIVAGIYPIPAADRDELVSLLLQDIEVCLSRSDKRLTRRDAGKALLALKTLGRDPAASRIISSRDNLTVLLNATKELRASDANAADDALRCVANALLLVESGRDNWTNIGGSAYCVDLLERTSVPSGVFLCCRILFLSTAAASSKLLQHLFDPPAILPAEQSIDHDIVSIISSQLDSLVLSVQNGTSMGKEALTDLLKFTFNILCHWPRLAADAEDYRQSEKDGKHVLGELWASRLDGLLPPLLNAFFTLPPMSPSPLAAPMAHILHSLFPIPINDRLRGVWFPEAADPTNIATGSGATGASGAGGSNRSTPMSSTKSSPTQSPTGSSSSALSLSAIKGKRKDSGEEIGHSRTDSRGVFDRALSKLTPRLSLSSRSPSPAPPSPLSKDAANRPSLQIEKATRVMQRAMDLFDSALAFYMPGSVDPDDAVVLSIEEDNPLDSAAGPLALLMVKLCKANPVCSQAFKTHVLPPDLDRSTPLEGRADTLGRMIRLMACVHHKTLKEATGELLFLSCNSDAQELSAQIGYGNAAGFLYNNNMLAAPPTTSSSSQAASSGPQINPITGTFQEERSNITDEMTQEEKEREAEKLFVLFERLEKAGGMENPIKKAFHEGKLEKYNKD